MFAVRTASTLARDYPYHPNGDRTANGGDLALVLSSWGVANGAAVADTNHDGLVDDQDLGVVLAAWGPCPSRRWSGLRDALADRKSHQVRAALDTQLLHHSLLMPINCLWTTR